MISKSVRLSAAVAVGLVALSAPGASPAAAECDVVVVGGGTAGVACALQSAYAGAKTVLVEQSFQVGGTMTGGGVNFPGLFHAWGRQVIDGVGYALVTNCVALAGDRLPDFSRPYGRAHWLHQITINIPLYVALAEEALVRAGVEVRYHASPIAIRRLDCGWEMTVAAVGDVSTLRTKQVVDCTGNAAVAHLAGFARVRGEERQPGTFVYTLDPQTDLASLDREALERAYDRAVREGRLEAKDARWGLFKFLQDRGNTANYVVGADNSTARLRTETNMRGRAAMLRMYRFVRTLKGLENAKLVTMSPEVGVRETYRIVGEYEVTADDYVSGRVFADSLCHAFYPVDLHGAQNGVAPKQLAHGVVPAVPLRALVPKGSRDFLVAGRCVASDRPANSGLRVEAACMAMGQVAGTAAALAAKHGTSPLDVPLPELRAALAASGAIIPEKRD